MTDDQEFVSLDINDEDIITDPEYWDKLKYKISLMPVLDDGVEIEDYDCEY